MLQTISEEELEFFECFYDSQALAECLLSDIDNPSIYEENKNCEIRIYQLPMLSFEYAIDDENPQLNKKQNFQLRANTGTIFCFGGRKFGKSIVVEIVDTIVNAILQPLENVGFSSYDAAHIMTIMEPVCRAFEVHPFLKLYKPNVKRSPNYQIDLKSGWRLISINQNHLSKNPGDSWFGKHLTRIYIEEASKECQGSYSKRQDAVSENGAIFRVAGMTDFTKYSPAGVIYYDEHYSPWVCGFPQYVSPFWDDEEREKQIKLYAGANSVGYRVYVDAQIVEEGISVFDSERVNACFDRDRQIKHFEIAKKTFDTFENILAIVERNKSSDATYISADIGESAPTEIMIFSKVADKFRYEYQITLYGLTDKEQYEIFLWLFRRLQAHILAVDTGDGTGRSIFRRLEGALPKERLVAYAGAKKIQVGFQKDDKGNTIFKNGVPAVVEEFMAEWSVKRLKDMFYENIFYLPMDNKLHEQINSVVATISGNRTVYSCLSKEDHLFDSFKVFSIAHWYNEFNNLSNTNIKKFCKTGV